MKLGYSLVPKFSSSPSSAKYNKIENIYNGSLFLQEIDKTVNLKLDTYFFDCAFVFLYFENEKDLIKKP